MDFSGQLKVKPSMAGVIGGSMAIRLIEPEEDRAETGVNNMTISFGETGKIFTSDQMLDMGLFVQFAVLKIDGTPEGYISMPLKTIVSKVKESPFS